MKSWKVRWSRPPIVILLDHINYIYLQKKNFYGAYFMKLPQIEVTFVGALLIIGTLTAAVCGCEPHVFRGCFWKGTTPVWKSSSPCGDRSGFTWWASTPPPCSSWFSPGFPSGSTRTPARPECPWVTCSAPLSPASPALAPHTANYIINHFETMGFRNDMANFSLFFPSTFDINPNFLNVYAL